MGFKMQTGLLLVIGTIVAGIGWMGIYPDGGGDPAGQTKAILADTGTAKVGILMGYGGILAVLLGLLNITRGMAMGGGAGAAYANVATFLTLGLLAGLIASLGLEYGSADVPMTQAGMAMAGTFQAIALAIGTAFGAFMGIVMILIAVGIYFEKNYHIVTAAGAVVAGVCLIIAAFGSGDAADVMELIGWIAFMATTLVIGGLTLKSES